MRETHYKNKLMKIPLNAFVPRFGATVSKRFCPRALNSTPQKRHSRTSVPLQIAAMFPFLMRWLFSPGRKALVLWMHRVVIHTTREMGIQTNEILITWFLLSLTKIQL
jgi:hypothetical protein